MNVVPSSTTNTNGGRENLTLKCLKDPTKNKNINTANYQLSTNVFSSYIRKTMVSELAFHLSCNYTTNSCLADTLLL